MTYEPVLPATPDVLATFDDEPPKRPAPWLLVGGVAALVLALVGGVTYGLQTFSGGGARPADVLPAGAFAYAEIDLDPPAGQKVDGFRFLRQFPDLRDKLSGDDLRKAVFEAVAPQAGWGDLDYESDVEPWLGQRLGVGVYPPAALGGKPGQQGERAMPTFVLALQVTDADKAETGLARLAEPLGFVVDGEYALLAESQEMARRAQADGKDKPLAGSGTYAADTADLGDGFASAWVDMAAAEGLAGMVNPLSLGAVGGLGGVDTVAGSGRAAYVARFDGPDAIEVAGRFTDADALAGVERATLRGMGDLPASTVVALGLAGGDQLVAPMWENLRKQVEAAGGNFDDLVDDAQGELGVSLPADLETLLGSNLLAALDSSGFDEGRFDAGVRTTTDPVRAAALITKLTAALASLEPDLKAEATHDGYVLATGPDMASRLSGGAADPLGSSEAFRRALPDVEGARMAVWVDVKPLVSSMSGMFGGPAESDESVDPNLEPIAGFGMTLSTDGDNGGSFRMRLVTD